MGVGGSFAHPMTVLKVKIIWNLLIDLDKAFRIKAHSIPSEVSTVGNIRQDFHRTRVYPKTGFYSPLDHPPDDAHLA